MKIFGSSIILALLIATNAHGCSPAPATDENSYETIFNNNLKVLDAIEMQRRKYAPEAVSWDELDGTLNRGEIPDDFGAIPVPRFLKRIHEKVQIAGYVIEDYAAPNNYYIAIHPSHMLPNMCETSPFLATRLIFTQKPNQIFWRAIEKSYFVVIEGVVGMEGDGQRSLAPLLSAARVIKVTQQRAVKVGIIGDPGIQINLPLPPLLKRKKGKH
jgi:hypothetical protein